MSNVKSGDRMRLFIAILFDAKTLDGLTEDISRLSRRSLRGNFSRRENLHLTLSFLGDKLSENAAKCALSHLRAAPFELRAGGYGRFTRPGGDIWWIAVEESAPLAALHRSLTAALASEGLPPERRPFTPHLTLGREVVTEEGLNPRDLTPASLPPIAVAKISLMKSERIAGRLTYTEIDAKRLTKGDTDAAE